MGSSRVCSRVTFGSQLQTAAWACEHQQAEDESNFPPPCKPSHPGMTLFQLINAVFLALCPVQLIHSPFCQSTSCPWVADSTRPQQENSRNSALEEGPEHKQPKEWIYLMPCMENTPTPRERRASLIVPGRGLRSSACVCSESKRSSKEPQQSFFSERRKPPYGKSPL